MASEVVSGAASGAAQGTAIMPGWGTVIGAGVGAISGFLGGRRRKKAEREERRRQKRIRQIASPEHLKELMAGLQPVMREIVAAGLGPQFQDAVNTNLAQAGLADTGAGEALRGLSMAAPGVMSTQMAGNRAQDVVRNQLAAEGIAGESPAPASNPLLDALMGGARGFMAGGGSLRFKPQAAAPGAPAAISGNAASDALPNLRPMGGGAQDLIPK